MASFNYRLGRFGFFAHPARIAAKEGPLGNFGYMDQLAALHWVQANIDLPGLRYKELRMMDGNA